MKTKGKLWLIFGPVIIAAGLLILLLSLPIGFGHFNSQTEKKAAVSLSPKVFRGRKIKQQALENGYVPFFGSSELSRLDEFHPSVLAAKYHRSYRPFLLGNAGSQSLTHYFTMQNLGTQLKGKKVIFIISPQWFTKEGQRPDAFGFYYSPLQTIDWIINAKNDTADRYAAKRLLEMPSGRSSEIGEAALENVEHGKPVSEFQKMFLKFKETILLNEDSLFSRFQLNNNLAKVQKGEKSLPAHYSISKLNHLAVKVGRRETTNNKLGIKNTFYKTRLSGNRIKDLKDSQTKLDYRRSPEYSDFELVLNQFAKWHVNVQFIIPPINARWADYTGLSIPMIRQTDQKIEYQLRQQGFNNVLDLSDYGNEKYFMEDTIHLGWRGWLKVDQTVNPFLTNKQPQPNYIIQNRFFSKNWQNTVKNE
ncbi:MULTISPECIES: D-alanyl-lipoteichoic acid biosynthesis protein DltD [Loigolactobacillus]|uniref:Protein DltD n=1 Tax=Loigolactobacillus backii TaxID=375175 RepID=A0A192GZI8_9LACO|nr:MULTISPECIES: D-alanyl-lipoteichoic acid biosynthesis protein DltD [Loigolactobacillus]ANK61505.1 D-alanyl-lipoteichoic acid biosynthesis protein DltD [Loigolactobacillus backii]ANK63821.1 D-alanyl-lipoteichoic acid biosynthesis protein DltD [Loigolactobacillus backii]ANK66269.1 D-alanyl-lipoteichoic acid biosynthesis protein DltD [Loigolactobacillus backii]ANK69297.1 D-alanyl-lipoteichoic acid biosynthesis protein DltD [Loigolactobacillus backii]MDA5388720.1 D-alanyl-lipoteichoic acid bios